MMDWAVRFNHERIAILNHTLPPFRGSPGGGMVQNEFTIRGDTAYVVLPNRCDLRHSAITVAIDKQDLPLMNDATDKWWYYTKPGCYSTGAYLLCGKNRDTISLARTLMKAPRGKYRYFKDGDQLNCRKENLGLLSGPPSQADWLWSSPLPAGFTLIRKLENSIVVKASTGADSRLMWQYLLERWQYCRSKDICLSVPRIHEQRTSWKRRISAIIRYDSQSVSFDIGEDGPREWQEYEVRETQEMAA
jgi:hypothetical protein